MCPARRADRSTRAPASIPAGSNPNPPTGGAPNPNRRNPSDGQCPEASQLNTQPRSRVRNPPLPGAVPCCSAAGMPCVGGPCLVRIRPHPSPGATLPPMGVHACSVGGEGTRVSCGSVVTDTFVALERFTAVMDDRMMSTSASSAGAKQSSSIDRTNASGRPVQSLRASGSVVVFSVILIGTPEGRASGGLSRPIRLACAVSRGMAWPAPTRQYARHTLVLPGRALAGDRPVSTPTGNELPNRPRAVSVRYPRSY